MPTKIKPSTEQEPSPDYISGGIDEAEKYANRQVDNKQVARGRVKGVVGGLKGRKWAKKVGAGKGVQRLATGAGFGLGRMWGRRRGAEKGAKKAVDKEAEGELPQSSKTKETAIEAGKEVGKWAYVQGIKNTVGNWGPWGRVAAIALTFPVEHPKISKYILLLILLLIFLPIYMLLEPTVIDPPPDNITSSIICVPAQINLGQKSTCVIRVVYNGSAQDIIITDTILPGSQFVSSDKGTYDPATKTITWDLAQLGYPLSPTIDDSVVFTVQGTTNNTNAYNYYQITPIGLTPFSASGTPSNSPPNGSTCGGKYVLNSPFKNFGDPNCNFTVQQLGQQLRQLDSTHYAIWDCIASHESGYNPNAYNPNSTSGNGAYGLFQMNPKGRGNGVYDAGNVDWPVQIPNAINYNNKVIGQSFAYWATYAGCH